MTVPVLISTSILLLYLASPTSPSKPGAQPSNPSDLKITTRQTLGTKSVESTEYLSGAWSRRERQPFPGDVPGHRRAIISRRGSDRVQVFVLDLDAREYLTYETTLQGTSPSVTARRLQPSGNTVQLFSDSVDTGETREIFGHVARHIITKVRQVSGPGSCASSSESETDGWYIGYDALPEWRRPGKGEFHIVSLGSSSNCANTFDKYELHRSGPAPGFPLTTTTTNRTEQRLLDGSMNEFTSSSKMEVVEFSQAPLDPALFQLPPGFRKVHRLADQRGPQSTAQALWQWLKDTWDDLFD